MTPKLSSLMPTDKIILAAELDGWVFYPHGHHADGVPEHWELGDFAAWRVQDLPQYSTSYDAIIPLIQKQDDDTLQKYFEIVGEMIDYTYLIHATPSQLLDALLVATGKAEL